MLTMSRLDAPTPQTNRTPVDINRMVAALVNERQPIASEKGQTLRFEADEHIVTINADQEGIYRVVSNLLANALTYTAEGGSIVIRTRLDSDGLLIEVQDNGIGMTPEVQARIFERFYRADPARRLETGGTGLGLAIVQRIVQNHGGSITVSSVPGAGSTFRVRLPE
jgi:signal transduction histidine kinase